MHRKALIGCALLCAGLSAVAARATTYQFSCSIGYMVSTQNGSLSSTPIDRVCTAQVVFMNAGRSGETSRSYSCTVLAGTSSCSLTIDPAASGVPAGFTPAAVATAPLHSATEESNGCTYLILDGFANPPQLYPSATVLTGPMPGMPPLIDVLHYFDCTTRP